MSPGRSRSRICDISARVSTPPMWHITLPPVPALSHAAMARLSGSSPFLESDVGDVHERVNSGTRLRRDVATEGGKVVGAGIAGRDTGGRTLVRNQLVGWNADGRAIGIDVRVEVDEPRRHQLA